MAKFTIINGVVATPLSELQSATQKDVEVKIYKMFGDALRKNRDEPHPYATGAKLKLAIKIDCQVKPAIVQAINHVMYKYGVKLYIICGRKARLAKIENLYQMITNQVITLDVRDKSRIKSNIVEAKKCLRTLITIDELVYTKEASSYNGDFMAICDKSEATHVSEREYTIVYRHGNVLNIVGDTSKMTKKQKDRYRKMNPIVFFNMTKDDIPNAKQTVKEVFGVKYREEDASSYQRIFGKFFQLNRLEITVEVIVYMINTLTKMCQDYVEQSSDSAYEFISNFVNIHLRYEEYLEMNQVLQLPDIVDFVVGNMIKERDVEIESFYEDRKDDDYESINSSYLGEDE